MATELESIIIDALEGLKAKEITVIDVRKLTGVTDTMIIATGTSNRHVKSLADNVATEAKDKGFRPLGIEGTDEGEWVLVDFADVVVHVMLPQARDFYDLESLWSGLVEEKVK